MKRTIAVALALAAVFVTGAIASEQGDHAMTGYIEMLKSDLKTQKVAVVTANMMMTEAEGEIFWPLYREWDAEVSKIMDARISLIRDYAENYDGITDEKADEIVKADFKLDDKRLKLEQKYYKKMAKALSPKIAARFFQIDNAITLLLRLQVASELPLVE